MSEATFRNLQDDIWIRLMSDKFLGAMPFMVEDKGNLLSDIAQALGVLNADAVGRYFPGNAQLPPKIGVCGIVRMPVGMDEFPDTDSGPLDFDLDVTVVENPVINRDVTQGGTGLTSLVVARRIYRLLKNYVPAGIAQNLTARKQCIVPTEEFAPLPAYNVMMTTREADPTVFKKISTPVWSIPSGNPHGFVTLSCATPGAIIYFTGDGSHPSLGNPAGVAVYGAGFNALAGVTYRAAAFSSTPDDGSIESDVALAIYT